MSSTALALNIPAAAEPLTVTNGREYTARELAGFLGVSERMIRMRCCAGTYTAEYGTISGQAGWKIPFSGLSEKDQYKLITTHPFFVSNIPAVPALNEQEIDAITYSQAADYNRKKIDKYSRILAACEGITGKRALDVFVEQWNLMHPELKTSCRSIYDARKQVEQGGKAALVGKHGNRSGDTIIKDIWFDRYKMYYMQPGSPSVRSCWLRTLGDAIRADSTITTATFPGEQTFDRRLNKDVPLPAQIYKREGPAAYNRKCAPYIDRDYSDIRAGQVWVGDHHQLDVACIDPATGKTCFPWLTAWMDFKTMKYVGWYLHCESPNSDHIFQSLHHGITQWGLPDEILIDNGKDYRSKDFAGGRRRLNDSGVNVKKCSGQLSALMLLHIKVHFALPYQAQTKNIERSFRMLITLICKHLPGYRGSNVVERPEALKNEIKHGDIMQFADFANLLDDLIITCYNRNVSQGKNLLGKSPDQLWAEEFTQKNPISPEALKLFCMRTSASVGIGKNGIMDNTIKTNYWGEWMAPLFGRKAYMRRDINNYGEAWIFDANTDEYLGLARSDRLSAPALATTEVGKVQFFNSMASKKRAIRITKQYAELGSRPDPMEQLLSLQVGIAAVAGHTPEANPKVHTMPDTIMDKVIREQRAIEAEGTSDTAMLLAGEGKRQKNKELKMFACEAV